MFSSRPKPKKNVSFAPALSSSSHAPPSSDEWVATLYSPPPPPPSYPYAHPYSYSLPFASSFPSEDPYPAFGPTKPAQLPEGPGFFRPLASGGGGDVRGYLGRPTPVGAGEVKKDEQKNGEETKKQEKVKQETKKLEPGGGDEAEKARLEAWEAYYASLPPSVPAQVIAPAAVSKAEKATGGGGGAGGDAALLPRIGYYVPPGTVEGALVATWPGGVQGASRTLMYALYDG